MENQFNKKEAIAQATKLFHKHNSAYALEYLLYQKDGVDKEDIVRSAKKKGSFNSILIDYGYLKTKPVVRPLVFYSKVIKNLKQIRGFKIITQKGTITCQFYPAQAPLTCHNFIELVKKKYFNGTFFHRVIPAFVTQDGDPSGTGAGGPGYSIRCEYNELKYDRNGLVGMALAGKDTGGSQYFITHLATPHLNHQYTIFAEVISGMGVVTQLCLYDQINNISLW
jgi:cyclophilin family peptidyl-prolyl cis-trans isomerase